jgi:hypothetical protein
MILLRMPPDDVEQIKDLKARYFRYFDTKQWDRWRDLFTEDCTYDGTSRSYSGRDEFVEGTRRRLDPATTVHQGHTPEIRILGPTSAKGIWPMFDHVEFDDVIDHGHGVSRGFTGFGHYEEEYRKENGEWKICFLRITRLYTALIDRPALRPFDAIGSRGRTWIDD